MSIKSKRITIRIFATFLILSLTLCYFTIAVSASDYSESNDTVYESADYWGLEELPYGVNTGVVQFQYKQGYLTLYFDKLDVFENAFNDSDTFVNYTQEHYWKVTYDNTSGNLDYLFSCTSNSPIYYKTTYSENGTFASSIGSVQSLFVPYVIYSDGNPSIEHYTYKVYEVEDFRLSELVPDWTIDISLGSRRVYSNCFQIDSDSTVWYSPYRASGPTNWINGKNVGYNVEYYPSVEYLQNVSLRDSILTEFFRVQTELIDIYHQMFSANAYLEQMYYLLYNVDTFVTGMHSLLDIYLPMLNYNLGEILTKLDEIKTGPEYDSSQGIGSNNEFGNAAGGLIDDNVRIPNNRIDDIQSNLGDSLLFIRRMFDRITSRFNLSYIIAFLLGLSFIAYVLGRVIKNKMR